MNEEIWDFLYKIGIFPNNFPVSGKCTVMFLLIVLLLIIIILGLYFGFQYKQTNGYKECFQTDHIPNNDSVQNNNQTKQKRNIDLILLFLVLFGFFSFFILSCIFYYIFINKTFSTQKI